MTTKSGGSAGGAWHHTFSSLGHRNFRYLWLGLVATMACFQMQVLAQGYLVYDITGSATILGLVNASSSFPVLALSLFGGAIADRVERKILIQVNQLVSASLALFIAITLSTGTLTWPHLLIVALLHGGVFAFLMPARQAAIPQLVDRDKLGNAVALSSVGMNSTTLVGPVIAGVLYAVVGATWTYYVIATLGFTAILITNPLPRLNARETPSHTSLAADIKEGLKYIWGYPLILVLIVTIMVSTILAMPFRFLLPAFVVDIYHRGPDALGLLLGLYGVGALIGSLGVAALGSWHRGIMLIAAIAVTGMALLGTALFPVYGIAMIIMVFLGTSDAGRRTLSQTLIMELSKDAYRGRVMSVFSMNYGLIPLGVLPAGIAVELLGGQTAIGILAVLLLAVGAYVLVAQKRVRDLM